MTFVSSLLLIAAVYLAVLASPGPNFFILSQLSLAGRKRQATHVVFGLTSGSIFWVVAVLAGLSTLLNQHPWLALGIRTGGSIYLVWYGIKLLRAAFADKSEPRPSSDVDQRVESRLAGFKIGLVTGMTNPKGAAFWTSAFAALLPAQAPLWFYLATVALVATLSLAWHLGVVLVFSAGRLRARYLRLQGAINGFAGLTLIMLGLKRLLSR